MKGKAFSANLPPPFAKPLATEPVAEPNLAAFTVAPATLLPPSAAALTAPLTDLPLPTIALTLSVATSLTPLETPLTVFPGTLSVMA